jgi:uncharacterized protein YndB with AHSA1/START domain
VITIAMATSIQAPRERVWRALTLPAERIRWDERTLSLESAAEGSASPGSESRYRYRLGSVPVELRGRALEVVPPSRLRHEMAIGRFRFEETYTLADDGTGRTRLSLRIAAATNTVPVLGGALDRFDVRRLASELADTNLRAVQRWCESAP